MMSGIRGKNTKPEVILRRGLHARGFRFRLHGTGLPGKPDLIFSKHCAVLFAHGCFWHGHDCHLFKWPKSREGFWRQKIQLNKVRDVLAIEQLLTQGWRVGEVWECALKGRERLDPDTVIDACAQWLVSSVPNLEIRGSDSRTPL